MPAVHAGEAVGHSALRAHAKTRARLRISLLAGVVAVFIAAVAPVQAAPTSTFSGRLELFHTDGKSGHSDTYTYELRAKRGTYYTLHFARNVRRPRPESRVRLRGVRHGRRIVVKRAIGVSAHSAAVATQAKKLAVILVNFLDNSSQPYTPEQVREAIWTGPRSVRAYYNEASFAQLELGSIHNPDGDVYGYYTIPYNEKDSSCPNRIWGEAAMTAARNAGVDLSGYTNIMFLFPEGPCAWAGSAVVGGPYSYLNGTLGDGNNPIPAHELGHNFGLLHAHSLICHDAAGNIITYNPNENDCTQKEYGDVYDTMGYGWHYQFNNYFKGVLGWWPSNAVVTTTSTGTYLLQPEETLGGGLQVLRFLQQTNSYGERRFYYLEFRQPSVFDDWSTNRFGGPEWVEEGVTVRLASDFSAATGSQLLNMNPTVVSETNPEFEWYAPLRPGHTYTDPVSGVAITTDSTSPLGASVTLTFPGGSTTTTTPPTVAIAAPASGATVSGSVGITAEASDNVGVSSVALAVDGHTLATPTSAPYSTSWSTTTVANGTHTITATAKDAAGNTASSSAIVSVSNSTIDTKPPTVPSGLSAAALSASQTALSWSPATDNVGVTAYDIYRGGTFLTTVSGTHFADSGLATATAYSYQVRARDAAGNVSALTKPVKTTTAQTKLTGALAGWVTKSATGLPLGGAKVTATLNGHSWSVNTSPLGFYQIPNLAPGTFSVSIAAAGYPTQTATLVVLANLATIDGVTL
jgi:hypothetical protein